MQTTLCKFLTTGAVWFKYSKKKWSSYFWITAQNFLFVNFNKRDTNKLFINSIIVLAWSCCWYFCFEWIASAERWSKYKWWLLQPKASGIWSFHPRFHLCEPYISLPSSITMKLGKLLSYVTLVSNSLHTTFCKIEALHYKNSWVAIAYYQNTLIKSIETV